MSSGRIKIILPWPAMALMPNRRNGRHWTSTTKARDSSRALGYFAAKAVCERFECIGNVPVSITFYAPDKRGRDLDGLLSSLKHALDGIADALGVNDKQFRPITIDAALDEEKKGYVLVEIGN